MGLSLKDVFDKRKTGGGNGEGLFCLSERLLGRSRRNLWQQRSALVRRTAAAYGWRQAAYSVGTETGCRQVTAYDIVSSLCEKSAISLTECCAPSALKHIHTFC